MGEEVKNDGLQGETVIRFLEQAERYGLDRETMLIYISSVNLMSILDLIGRRYGDKPDRSLPATAPEDLSTPLPAPSGTAPVDLAALATALSGIAPGDRSMENLTGILAKMPGGPAPGNPPATQGVNPALLNLVSVIGQNLDLGNLIGRMAGMRAGKARPASSSGEAAIGQQPPGPGGGDVKQPVTPGTREGTAHRPAASGPKGGSVQQQAPPGDGQPPVAVKENGGGPITVVEKKQAGYEAPRIIKWDQL